MDQEFGSYGNLQWNQRAAPNVPLRAMPQIIACAEDERQRKTVRRSAIYCHAIVLAAQPSVTLVFCKLRPSFRFHGILVTSRKAEARKGANGTNRKSSGGGSGTYLGC
jgi:hypothetical protein